MPIDQPLVSVIIPTTRRHDLVLRAVASAAAQTIRDIEIIVVVDGNNPRTVAALARVDEDRMLLLQTDRPSGAGAARNFGAAHARGEWVAFLDDDDEWLPEKLERQLALAGDEDVMLSCRSLVQTPQGTFVWPYRLYDGVSPIDEYLFNRKSLLRGRSYMPVPSFMMRRALFERTQFGTSRQNEDTTLLLRVTKEQGVRLVTVPEPLVVIHTEEDSRPSLGSSYEWREMLAWADATKPLLTRRAYSGFCLIYLGSQAARRGDLTGFGVLLWRALTRGAPTPTQLALYLTFWVLPIGLRRRIRSALSRSRPSGFGAAEPAQA